MDPDKTAPTGAVRSKFTLFVKKLLKHSADDKSRRLFYVIGVRVTIDTVDGFH